MGLGNAPVLANLPAVDLDRAKSFYSEKLGLKEVGTMDEGGVMYEASVVS